MGWLCSGIGRLNGNVRAKLRLSVNNLTKPLDYLGQNVDARRAMAQCGLFSPEALDPRIVQLVRNDMAPGAWTFEVEQL